MKNKIIEGDSNYPRKTRLELEKEDVIYPAGCFIQVLDENKRYIADGKRHFSELHAFFDFPNDLEAYFDGFKIKIRKR